MWDSEDSQSDSEKSNDEQPKRKRGRIPNPNSKNEDAKLRRLELNRQSAKDSRKRKKQYMQNLEQ